MSQKRKKLVSIVLVFCLILAIFGMQQLIIGAPLWGVGLMVSSLSGLGLIIRYKNKLIIGDDTDKIIAENYARDMANSNMIKNTLGM